MRRSTLPAARHTALLAPAARLMLPLLTAAMLLAGCGRERIDVVGSDTMVHLAQRWAEDYGRRQPQTSLSVSGGGSGTGLAGLINGYAHVALSSRPLAAAEQSAAARRGLTLRGRVVGYDGLAVIVHPANPVRALTLAQTAGLFTGQIANWSALGGPVRPVVVVSRAVNSGTHIYFRAAVLAGADFAAGALQLPSSQQVHDTVARTPGAVGYVGLAFVTPAVRALAVAPRPGAEPVAPDLTAVRTHRYPISRPLWLYHLDPPAPAVRRFIAWCLGPGGQAAVQAAGFVPAGGP